MASLTTATDTVTSAGWALISFSKQYIQVQNMQYYHQAADLMFNIDTGLPFLYLTSMPQCKWRHVYTNEMLILCNQGPALHYTVHCSAAWLLMWSCSRVWGVGWPDYNSSLSIMLSPDPLSILWTISVYPGPPLSRWAGARINNLLQPTYIIRWVKQSMRTNMFVYLEPYLRLQKVLGWIVRLHNIIQKNLKNCIETTHL